MLSLCNVLLHIQYENGVHVLLHLPFESYHVYIRTGFFLVGHDQKRWSRRSNRSTILRSRVCVLLVNDYYCMHDNRVRFRTTDWFMLCLLSWYSTKTRKKNSLLTLGIYNLTIFNTFLIYKKKIKSWARGSLMRVSGFIVNKYDYYN